MMMITFGKSCHVLATAVAIETISLESQLPKNWNQNFFEVTFEKILAFMAASGDHFLTLWV